MYLPLVVMALPDADKDRENPFSTHPISLYYTCSTIYHTLKSLQHTLYSLQDTS